MAEVIREALTRVLLRRVALQTVVRRRIVAATYTTIAKRPAARSALATAPAAAPVRPSIVRDVARLRARWYSSDNELPGVRVWDYAAVKELEASPEKKKDVVIVDVREPAELIQFGKIPGAINIPITSAVQSFHISDEDFSDMFGYERPPQSAELLIYCRSGVRARSAAGLAQHAGWKNVGMYPGSWLDWEKNGGTVEKVEGSKK